MIRKQRTFKIREKILKCLLDRELRFMDLRRILSELSKSTFKDNLKFLNDNGLIIKRNKFYQISSFGEETINKDYSYEDLKNINKIQQNYIFFTTKYYKEENTNNNWDMSQRARKDLISNLVVGFFLFLLNNSKNFIENDIKYKEFKEKLIKEVQHQFDRVEEPND